MNLNHYIMTGSPKGVGKKFFPALRGVFACLMSVVLAVSFSSCIMDCTEDPEPVISATKAKYYLSLTVTVPVGTRSYTEDGGNSNDGTLPGTDPESELRNAQLFFCVDDEIKLPLTAFLPTKERESSDGIDNVYSISAEIEDIADLAALAGQDVKLYVVGNYTTVGNHTFSSTRADATFSVGNLNASPIGDYGTNGMPMPLVNAEEVTLSSLRDIVATGEDERLEAVKSLFVSSNSELIYEMGTLKLERAVARLDYKDRDRTSVTEKTPYRYEIGRTAIKADLNSMQVFNVNTSSYLFRHTAYSADSKAAAGDVKLFGVENDASTRAGYNWIAGSDWTKSGAGYVKNATLLNPVSTTDALTGAITGVMVSSSSAPGSITIAELTATGDKARTLDEDGYYPWCYITENTLPSVTTDAATNATGVVFNFKILNTNGAPLTFEEVANSRSTVPAGITKETADGKNIKITDSEGYNISVNYTDGEGDEAGYFLSYYGHIIHNDPEASSPGAAPMYYAVVRNTVYQLSVQSLSTLPNPDYPDLEIEMKAKVFPWDLRIDDNVILK